MRGSPAAPSQNRMERPLIDQISLWRDGVLALNPPVQFRKVALIGVGLLGGSLGLALRARRLAEDVHGFVRRSEVIASAESAGVVDRATTNLGAAVAGADLVILCSPLGQMPALMQALAPHLASGAIVTDVGSAKTLVVEQLEPLAEAAGAWFVGSHPMAGSERSGFQASRADLFEKALCVVTPTLRTHAPAQERVEALWRGVGANLLTLSPQQHDELVSRSSHLPHVVAAGLVNYVLSPSHTRIQATLCATGFRDTTRVAGSSPEMWRDIAAANRQYLSRALGVLVADLQEFQRALDENDLATIEDFFTSAQRRRDLWLASNQAASGE
jgi:prephenate dehydrogenase